MFRISSNFISRVRASDDGTKRRWLFVFTVPTMIVVVFLWVMYVRAFLPENEGGTEVALADESSGTSLTSFRETASVLRTGAGVVIGEFLARADQAFKLVGAKLAARNVITVQVPIEPKFVVTDLPPIPVTPLR